MAPRASSKIRPMKRLLGVVGNGLIVGMLAACGIAPLQPPATPSAPPPGTPPQTTPLPQWTPASPTAPPPSSFTLPPDTAPLPPPIVQGKSRWVPVRWAELPGLAEDPLHEAWNAWLKSCEKPGPTFGPLCGEVRRLSIGTLDEQRAWLFTRLQAYRVEPLQADPGGTQGLLTSYYEPVLDASRSANADFKVPLYQPPIAAAGLALRKPWYTRQEIDTLPQAQAALKGREIAFLADPVDALVLQIQGSGRVRITQPDGTKALVRLTYAASNEQPYKSVGRWLIDQGALKDATWPAIKAWTVQNPQRVQEMLWSNPRTVFFREESVVEADNYVGPRGAQGVPLTAGRSIAVDPASIPYGTPVWLASSGPVVNLQKLVLAQDTGSAILGAVRADYFAGTGYDAGELAGRLKQPLRLWVLWPRR
jgi:membrane-bound lytic murein transglycosylase A